MRRLLPFATIVALLMLSGCFEPKTEEIVQQWHPMGATGPTMAQALAASPRHKHVVWESYTDAAGGPMARVSVEYDSLAVAGSCPSPAPDQKPAARIFLVLEFTVAPDRTVTFVSARGQVYSAKGYFEEYPMGLSVMADLMAKTFPLSCADLTLPAYL